MKYICTSTSFISAVEQVSKARSKSNQTEMLQDIFFILEDHLLTIRATNLELFCEKSIPVKGLYNGSVTIKGDILVKTIQTLKTNNNSITCEVVNGVFIITTGKDVLEIKTTANEGFPKLPKTGKEILNIEQEELNKLIKDVLFCAATTEIKPEIACVFIFTNENKIISVATDTYRLAEKIIQKPDAKEGDVYLLIPQKYCNEILSILDNEDGPVIITQNETSITLTKGTLSVCCQITLGHFPDYKQLFPKTTETLIKINKQELAQALNATNIFIENYTPLLYQTDGNTLVLQTKNENLGSATKFLQTEHKGGDIKAHYNNRYFIDVLPHLQGDVVTMQFTTPTRPMIITSNGDLSFTYLLMPINR